MPSKSAWTPEMYERLAELYPHHTNKVLETMMGWPVKELQYRAGILKIVKTYRNRAVTVTRTESGVDIESFIRANYDKMTNKELAASLGVCLQTVRDKCYAMGLLRMKLEYWSDEQTQYLRDNYRQIGDSELAEIFNTRWVKQKTWTIKHIEKKRMYLKLKRTKDELSAIHDRNVEQGRFSNCPVSRWLKHGVFKEGDVRMWRCTNGRYVPFMKVNGKFIHWARYTWEQAYGPVAPGMNIVFKNDNPYEYEKGISILECVSNAELSARNSLKSSIGLSDNYIAAMLSIGNKELRAELKRQPDLLELKRNEILLTRAIKTQEKCQTTH